MSPDQPHRIGSKRPATEIAIASPDCADATSGSHAPVVAAAAAPAAATEKRHRSHKKVPKQHRVGNFRSYYNYRLGHQQAAGSAASAAEIDPRLSVLDRAWFAGKRGLDVGCNSGDLTIAIAKTFSPQYLLGVDVDPQLISKARGNLKDFMQKQRVEDAFHAISSSTTSTGDEPTSSVEHGAAATESEDEAKKKPLVVDEKANATNKSEQEELTSVGDSQPMAKAFDQEMPLSFRLWKPPMASNDKIPKALGKAALATTFPYNVVFKCENIATETHAGKDYDFITCFSVTKWIHLFHGDDGLKKVFQHFYDLLAPNGRLLLEPQPWKSYHKRKFTSEVTVANYAKIELRPKDFPDFLTTTVGFKSCTFLKVCQTSSKGFKRPIYVVEK